MNIDDMQMSTLSEELSLMLSCLRESQLQAVQQSQYADRG